MTLTPTSRLKREVSFLYIIFMMRAHKIKLAILLVLLFTAVISIYAAFREERNGVLTVAFLNVGQGDAIFIDTPSGHQMLIDGGPSKGVLRELSKVMPFYDKSIDAVIATHPDSDHISGLNDVLSKYKVGLFMEPGVSNDSSVYVELKNKVENKKITSVEARRGMIVDFGDNSYLQILFPVADPDGMDTNAASVIARLVYGENEFLFTGDSPINIEEYLASLGGLQSDVLKAGHHGSKTSTSKAFVSAVSPEYTVISVGKDNKYGHPNQEVLDVLNNFGIKILRTDQSGRIIFESDGMVLKLK